MTPSSRPKPTDASLADEIDTLLQQVPRSRDGTFGAAPNATLRTALFAGANAFGKRGLRRAKLASLSNLTLIYTGMRLDQGDLDCWMAVLQAAHENPIDERGVYVVSGQRLLTLMGLQNTGPNQELLDARLSKLKSGAIDLKGERFSYEGSLIDEVYRDAITRRIALRLNPKMAVLFGAEAGWTRLDLEVRNRIGRNQLAKWLHAFVASHRRPMPISVEKLHQLSGSDVTERYKFRQLLKDAIKRVNAAAGWSLALDPETDQITGNPIQARLPRARRPVKPADA